MAISSNHLALSSRHAYTTKYGHWGIITGCMRIFCSLNLPGCCTSRHNHFRFGRSSFSLAVKDIYRHDPNSFSLLSHNFRNSCRPVPRSLLKTLAAIRWQQMYTFKQVIKLLVSFCALQVIKYFRWDIILIATLPTKPVFPLFQTKREKIPNFLGMRATDVQSNSFKRARHARPNNLSNTEVGQKPIWLISLGSSCRKI